LVMNFVYSPNPTNCLSTSAGVSLLLATIGNVEDTVRGDNLAWDHVTAVIGTTHVQHLAVDVHATLHRVAGHKAIRSMSPFGHFFRGFLGLGYEVRKTKCSTTIRVQVIDSWREVNV